ncbi:MAG: UDP-N-acetylmuramoyl-L-alanine--D-glutamate ligase [Deltaproteobacteria bacterium]|nr:UDP-N-acetylmuramoyl-L-alanine--D-glutamate ligase [Deltaproteobacteria bacterium]MBW2361457.1 UDP-N-acetylmuramoyl-L-alanine--D-glutamate ligase [Deltaproteobacteria bacterium]
MVELTGQKVLVLGLGMTGASAARFCAERGARVVVADERPDVDTSGLPSGIEVRAGQAFPDPGDFDLVIPSPGIPHARYASKAKRAWGDIELAFRFLKVPIIAVTGTNGKSTTVRLIEAMLRAAGLRARAAGNLGEPALDLVGQALDVAVLEVSSFQLEAVDAFRPKVGVLLNLSPDHLDRHETMAGYLAAKARLFARQDENDHAILDLRNTRLRELASELSAAVHAFDGEAPVERGASCDGSCFVRTEAEAILRFPLPGGEPLPEPLRSNALAAWLAACLVGADPARALGALGDFQALPHRLERVCTIDDVEWIDDSKATNPGAAARALEGMERSTIWIAGGRDKGLPFDELVGASLGRVRRVLLIGEAAASLGRALSRHATTEQLGTLEAAVARAAELAVPGDAVLLAPACASFDQFTSFEERGDRFTALVHALTQEESP